MAVGVDNGGFIVEDDVLIGSRTGDEAVNDRDRSGGGGINRSTSYEFGAVKVAKCLTVNIGS